MIKYYYTYNKETLEVNQEGISTTRFSKIPEYPRDALLVEPLAPKDGFLVRVVGFENGRPTGTEYVSDNRGKTIYNKNNPLESKVVDYLGDIKEGWTLLKPTSNNYEFDDEKEVWVLNKQKALESELYDLNVQYDRDMLELSKQYNIACARDCSVETLKVAEVRERIEQLDAEYDSNQIQIITKYSGE